FKRAEAEANERTAKLLSIKGKRTPIEFHRELGRLMWDDCGMARTAQSLKKALQRIPEIREEFWRNVSVPGSGADLNQALERAGRVADFLEFAELLCLDALERNESCGAHFREEHQFTEADPAVKAGTTSAGEVKRDDEHYMYVAAWEHGGVGTPPTLHKEPLVYEEVKPSVRSYK
ncbi:MAG TPA: fumarate reductase/succinate dehydrogenase flavoprotein subunit, partial [Gemmataceae bacterium]